MEAVYFDALRRELLGREIPFRSEHPIPVFYKGEKLNCGCRADFLCFDDILVEIKAQSALGPVDEAQVINYLRATELERALLLNFGTPNLQIKRLILTAECRHRVPDH